MRYKDSFGKELAFVISRISGNRNLLQSFLKDLLTPAELKELSVRWQIIKQLQRGVPQRTIAKNLGVSVATITRGSLELGRGSGGFKKALESVSRQKKA